MYVYNYDLCKNTTDCALSIFIIYIQFISIYDC